MQTISQDVKAGTVYGSPLILLRLEGLLVLILSILVYLHSGASWWRFGVFLPTPDLAMAAYWWNPRSGATLYNLAHNYAGPLLLILVALTGARAAVLPWALIWTAHIALDRALGYGLKYPESFKMTHLGSLGRSVVK